jgi:excinuclease UvrABC nuclease subunit
MVGGVLFKKYYRRYKIRTQQISDRHSNDYAALKELIMRRFSAKEKKSDDMPDLFILDG